MAIASQTHEAAGFRNLFYRYWALNKDLVSFQFEWFSFVNMTEEDQLEMLDYTVSVFYFKGFGGHAMCIQWLFLNPCHKRVIVRLKELICYGSTMYFGVCGGAKIFGKRWLDCPGLSERFKRHSLGGVDLLSCMIDMTVDYGDQHSVVTDDLEKIQITNGCSVVVILKGGEYRTSCLCAIDKRNKHKDFMNRNNDKLRLQAQSLLRTWTLYREGDELDSRRWRFCLDGRWSYVSTTYGTPCWELQNVHGCPCPFAASSVDDAHPYHAPRCDLEEID